MGPSPEPNLTVLYSSHLPEGFRTYAAKIAKESSSIQFENDDLLRENWALTTVQSHVVFLQQLWVKICNSSALVRT